MVTKQNRNLIMTNALLLSASKEGDSGYLEHALPLISQFIQELQLGSAPSIVFIPYAGVSVSYDDYFQKVDSALSTLSCDLTSIHHYEDPKQAICNADIVLIGGGNTFALLDRLYKQDLVTTLKEQFSSKLAYIGWSAGSNIAGASIKTTNDMPIVEPTTFDALGFLPFQLNPHYTDYQAPGHNGETREMRLQEFMVLNPSMPIVGIQEGSALRLKGHSLILQGNKVAYEFIGGAKTEKPINHDFSYLMEKTC